MRWIWIWIQNSSIIRGFWDMLTWKCKKCLRSLKIHWSTFGAILCPDSYSAQHVLLHFLNMNRAVFSGSCPAFSNIDKSDNRLLGNVQFGMSTSKTTEQTDTWEWFALFPRYTANVLISCTVNLRSGGTRGTTDYSTRVPAYNFPLVVLCGIRLFRDVVQHF